MSKSKELLKTKCLLLCFVFIFTLVIFNVPVVSAATGNNMWQFSSGFSSTQGQNQWYYSYWNGSSFQNMTWDAVNGYWTGNEDYLLIANKVLHPGANNDAALGWKAPYNMSISIKGNMLRDDKENGDGNLAKIVIVRSGTVTQLWPSSGWQEFYPGSFATHVFTTTVSQGDIIYFQVNKKTDFSYDKVDWDPIITQNDWPMFITDKTERVMSPTDLARCGITFIDSCISPIYNSSGDNYWIHSESGYWLQKMQGPLNAPGSTSVFKKPKTEYLSNPNGIEGNFWIMNIYKHSDGTLLGVVHIENCGPNLNKFRVGLAKSTNNGDTWTILGTIIQQYGDPENANIGAGPLLIKDGYFYTYYMEVFDPNMKSAVARASVTDVMNAASNNTVCNWYKYYNGSWNEAALLGNYTPINVPRIGDHTQGAYSSYDNKYYMSTGASSQLCYSTDMINWSSAGDFASSAGVYSDNRIATPYYSFIVDADGTANDLQVGQSFYLYFTETRDWNLWQNTDMTNIYRTKITLTDSSTASAGFTGTQCLNQWYYKQWNGSSYSDMTWDSVNSRWQGAQTYCLIYNNGQHPDANDSARAWKAPKDGIVRVTGNPRKSTAGGDGVNVKIMKNGTQVWPASGWQFIGPNDTTGVNHDVNVSVSKDDMIYFIVNKYSNNTSDSTYWDPTLEYTGDSFKPTTNTASKQYSKTQGQYQWNYKQWNGSLYSDMTWDSTNSRWSGVQTYCLLWNNGQHPDTNDSVRAWKAPKDGIARITGNPHKSTTGGDGVTVKIMKNGTQVWPESGWQFIGPNDTTGVNHDVNVSVSKDDMIYFVVNKYSNNTSDSTYWDPTLEYIPDTYTASSQFTLTQSQYQWYFKQWNGSAYSDMTWDSTNSRWQGAQTYCLISLNQQHPDTNDSVRAWKAPKDGTVKLTGNIHKVTTGGDGVNVKIIRNGTQVWPTSGWQFIGPNDITGVNHDINVSVSKDDMIYFIVNKYSNNTSDSTYWDPMIGY